ncbi:hypothetical protein F2Q69_00011814 [Brassica cretica]|uniref:Uncharacterized protein n=1 Tax=Brassica cretica TaxID=69181 RepID=A0A8S9QXH2_BRACR|nr:hypothetical protein F2Q69_00011814 [Brassica cretica]
MASSLHLCHFAPPRSLAFRPSQLLLGLVISAPPRGRALHVVGNQPQILNRESIVLSNGGF